MSYALATLWHERQRYLPGVLAVGFSAILIALQCGLLLGLFSITSLPVDNTRADMWVGSPRVVSVDLGEPIRESTISRVACQPEVARCEAYAQGFAYWAKPNGGRELCMVIGSRLGPDALGRVEQLTPAQCAALTEPGAVVVDDSDLDKLGVKGIGDTAEVSGYRVKVVGLTHGLRSLAGPFVFCSLTTARARLRMQPDQVTYVLARCERPEQAAVVTKRLGESYKDSLSAWTSAEFSEHTRWHWLLRTKAGFALGYAALLGLLVGMLVTSQTLYAATVASLREYAVLRALGIPRWRMKMTVLAQSWWVGIIGLGLAFPIFFGLASVGERFGVPVLRPWWLLLSTGSVTLLMALMSGLLALKSLRQVEPATLLR